MPRLTIFHLKALETDSQNDSLELMGKTSLFFQSGENLGSILEKHCLSDHAGKNKLRHKGTHKIIEHDYQPKDKDELENISQ